jgi:acyl-CoA thioesterase-1
MNLIDFDLDCTRRRLVFAAAGMLGGIRWASANTGTNISANAKAARILVMGDSLSAEYGLPRGTGWVALLQARLAEQHVQAEVINASISGETTAGGRTRLPALLKQHAPTHVIIELGANDALRGLPLKSSQDNFQVMLTDCQQAKAQVLLLGMMVPPNYGKRYTEDFAKLYASVAQHNRAALVPFFLKGVADRPDARDWFQNDGIHPLPKAHPIMMEQVWGALKPLLLGHQARA